MDLKTANDIFTSIRETSLTSLKDELIAKAVRYARIRTDWYFMSMEERRNIDPARTLAHDSFISSCNILSRNMAKAGEDNSWRAALGDDRKVIGDFACHLHAILGILSR
ncbi:MAG: hypothetical protein AB7D06_18560 [Pedobacter sp.]